MRHIQPLAVFIQIRVGDGADAGRINVLGPITIPVALWCDKWRVRVGVGDSQEKRFFTGRSRQIVQTLHPFVFNFIVVVDLHAAHAGPSFEHRAHAHAGRAVGGPLQPVWSPSKVCRVNVGGQTLLKAVQLVWTHEMHLAAQDGSVACPAQIVRHGGY